MLGRKMKWVNNIDCLQERIAKTVVTDMKQVVYQIVKEQIESNTVAQASSEYAFITVSPTMKLEEKSTQSAS
ncbi:MAG: hypothetical protein ABS23_10875 [SAR92 bacterium BACL16 MAG-120619-bin48]|jgi:hypothetical protein|nr:MAG: hypothetical protein ABS23_10875 [SAR92 bacterium BACL16 MAG-120619-bin48]|tara:strand:+ start:3458 stop:3673 length:216 start_codon:yes stop_codon:yes gene_type:complete